MMYRVKYKFKGKIEKSSKVFKSKKSAQKAIDEARRLKRLAKHYSKYSNFKIVKHYPI